MFCTGPTPSTEVEVAEAAAAAEAVEAVSPEAL